MWKYMKDFFVIPEEIKEEFQEASLQKNKISINVMGVMIVGIELFNIARVLFWSKSGLGTLNNRIYFGMYCTLLLVAVLSFVLPSLLQKKSRSLRLGIQYAVIEFYYLWHILLNSYDLMKNPNGEIYVFQTAMLALAVFAHVSNFFSILFMVSGYVLFMFLNNSYMDAGAKVNLTITAVVSMALLFTRSHQLVLDISRRRELKELNAQLQTLMQKDPLTGLSNKKAVCDRAELMVSDASKENVVALCLVDLDDFKRINDTYGHPCGDYVLEQVARKMEEVFTSADCIGRIGGDEFLIVMTGAVDAGRLQEYGERLIHAVSGIVWKKEKVGACCSMGILLASRSDLQYSQMYEMVDNLLYEAKRKGKGCCCVKEIS